MIPVRENSEVVIKFSQILWWLCIMCMLYIMFMAYILFMVYVLCLWLIYYVYDSWLAIIYMYIYITCQWTIIHHPFIGDFSASHVWLQVGIPIYSNKWGFSTLATPTHHGVSILLSHGHPWLGGFRAIPFIFHSPHSITLSGWWFQPLWKIWKSVGMIIPNLWKNKNMFQTTNQIIISQ